MSHRQQRFLKNDESKIFLAYHEVHMCLFKIML